MPPINKRRETMFDSGKYSSELNHMNTKVFKNNFIQKEFLGTSNSVAQNNFMN